MSDKEPQNQEVQRTLRRINAKILHVISFSNYRKSEINPERSQGRGRREIPYL